MKKHTLKHPLVFSFTAYDGIVLYDDVVVVRRTASPRAMTASRPPFCGLSPTTCQPLACLTPFTIHTLHFVWLGRSRLGRVKRAGAAVNCNLFLCATAYVCVYIYIFCETYFFYRHPLLLRSGFWTPCNVGREVESIRKRENVF